MRSFQKKQAAALALVVVVAVVAVTVLRSRAPAGDSAKAALQTRAVTRQPGRHDASVYALEWSASTKGEVSPAGSGRAAQLMKIDTAMTAEVLVESLGYQEGARGPLRLRAFSLRSLAHFSVKVMDQESVPDLVAAAKELTGPAAVASFDARGQVQGVAYDETPSPAAKQLLRAVVQLYQHTGPALSESAWEATESGTAGDLRVRYSGDGTNFVRAPLEYTTLDSAPGVLDGRQVLTGETRFVVGDDARLESASGHEELSYRRPGQEEASFVSEMTFTLTRTGGGLARQPDPAALAARVYQPLQERPADPGLAARRDQRMAALVSAEAISLEIEHYAGGAKIDHSFLARAAAWLRVHPEGAKALEQRFELATTSIKARGFILDLLVAAGDKNAQTVLRAALASPAAASTPGDHGLFLQRFSFIDKPDPDSARFLREVMVKAASTPQAQQGAAVALGSVVQALEHQGHPELAATYNRELVERLGEAKEKNQQRALLSALGNAGRPENVATLLTYVGASEPTVREQAASALRSVDSQDARAALITLAADAQGGVSMLAIRSLSQQALSGADWASLRGEVEKGRVNTAADSLLVELVRKQRAQAGEAAEVILRAVLARNPGGENDLGGVIGAMLAQR